MRVINVIHSIDISNGGPSRSITHLIQEMLKIDKKIEIGLETLLSNTPIINSFDDANGDLSLNKFNKLGYSKFLNFNLENSNAEIFHGHALWQMPVYQMAKIAQNKNIPYIITPRGMLEPWSLTQGRFKKQLSLKLFQYNDLEKASCIHATSSMEAENIRALGLKNPIAMIPNGVKIEDFPEKIPNKDSFPKKILFLSRIHPKKGIENLIEAWNLIDNKIRGNWKIEIVGNGNEKYIRTLTEKISSYGLNKQIIMMKPVFGEKKIQLFRGATLFVLPSYSENFGIVIAEALACYTPVITTKRTPWGDLNHYNCGWWIDIGVDPLKEALEDALCRPNEDINLMGVNGRKLVIEKYSINSIAKKMFILYEWLLKKNDKPNFVQLWEK